MHERKMDAAVENDCGGPQVVLVNEKEKEVGVGREERPTG